MEIRELPLSLWFIFSLASMVACVFVYTKLKFYVWKFPPGPFVLSYSIIRFLLSQEKHKLIYRLREKYGPLFSVPGLTFNVVFATDFETAKDLLSHPATQVRSKRFLPFMPGDKGFGGLAGDVWHEQRKFCMNTMRTLGFGKGSWEILLQKEAAGFVEHVQKKDGRPTDVIGPLYRSIVTSYIAILTNQHLSEEESNLYMIMVAKVAHSIKQQFAVRNPVIYMPGWLLKHIVKFSFFGYAEHRKVLEEYDHVFRREVLKYLSSPENGDTDSFIGRYFEALNENKANGERTDYYTVDNLVGHLLHLFLAGSDTTVMSIEWLILLMAAYPDVQKKVHEEIDGAIGRTDQACWDDRQRLPYTMAAIFEMERWAALFPIYFPRSASETFEFRGYVIPKDTVIIGSGWQIHRDPKCWDNPDKYEPERFLQTAESDGKVPLKINGYAPFSFGKRNCPGESVAITAIFIFFTQLMQKFTITTVPGRQVDLNPLISDVFLDPKSQELCFTKR